MAEARRSRSGRQCSLHCGGLALATLLSVLLAACNRPEPASHKEAAQNPSAQARDDKPAAGGLLQGAASAGPATATTARLPVVELATPQSVTVGKGDGVAFVIESAATEARNAESIKLVLQVRMRNLGPYQTNFWDASFRLVTHNAVIAASGGLNALVDGRSDSALERVQFVVPTSSVPRALRIDFGGESTELPLRLL
jgi:hypothetical protein